MKNVLIINAHEPYPFSEGKLTRTLIEIAESHLKKGGYEVRHTAMTDDYDAEEEVAKHEWADAIILQAPVNWMGVPWSFKKYMDMVYSAGMFGRLCDGDGRTRSDGTKQYGSGGTQTGSKYMLSVTLNAPKKAFNDPAQDFFEGKSIDDLFWPTHLNFKFFGMTPLETFSCHDVLKNPEIESDLTSFQAHMGKQFPSIA